MLPLLRDMDPAREWRRWCPSMDMPEAYFSLLTKAGPVIAASVRLLARSDTYPAVFHCMAGKDRTGVLAAVLLGLLGVRDEDIVNDYVLSERYFSPVDKSARGELSRGGTARDLPLELLRAAPETMESFVWRVKNRYGSVQDFVIAQGVTEDDILGLTANMVSLTGEI